MEQRTKSTVPNIIYAELPSTTSLQKAFFYILVFFLAKQLPVPIYRYGTSIPVPIYRYIGTGTYIPVPLYWYLYTGTYIPVPLYRYLYTGIPPKRLLFSSRIME